MIGCLIGGLVGASRAEADPGPADPSTSQNILLAVHCGSSADVAQARTVLQETGAADIAETAESAD